MEKRVKEGIRSGAHVPLSKDTLKYALDGSHPTTYTSLCRAQHGTLIGVDHCGFK